MNEAELDRRAAWMRDMACRFGQRLGLQYHDVQDAAQEAVMQGLVALQRFDESKGASWQTFVGKRLRGAVMDWVRNQAGSRRAPEGARCADEPSYTPRLDLDERDDAQATLAKIIPLLTPTEYATVKQMAEGHDGVAIAAREGVSHQAVYMRLWAMRRRLRKEGLL